MMKQNILVFLILTANCYYLVQSQEQPKRPQTPQPPFPYNVEDVKFNNPQAKITLAGTLTYPKNKKQDACVVLTPGTGGHTRDQDVGGHKTFMVWAHHLTQNNIAVLRFDERGIGESTGNFTEARYTDFSDDVIAGINFMKQRKEFSRCKFGVIGHSKGGFTAMLAAKSSKNVDFIVLLASPGIDGETILYQQIPMIMKYNNETEEEINKNLENIRTICSIVRYTDNRDVVREKILKYVTEKMNVTNEAEINFYMFFTEPFFRDFMFMNPTEVIRHVKKQAVLGLWGSKDVQVLAKENMRGVADGLKLGGNKRHKLMILDGYNHLFQKAITGSTSEYLKIEETISPVVLNLVTKWIKRTV